MVDAMTENKFMAFFLVVGSSIDIREGEKFSTISKCASFVRKATLVSSAPGLSGMLFL